MVVMFAYKVLEQYGCQSIDVGCCFIMVVLIIDFPF